ncbi:DNA-binding PadR family transcriptional regulator [Catenuloplanes nepalensis]|uniref:DNA-binding PadR family transcriptional regulator n=1 Tax=Catenuloplanes nepalensis TaxID=587533 RepID=A0ABT9MP81_9ACTN|nr:PadR family transcriptional regulator [Catenuloplanes nepalensis]MDP9792861.1 DNA-binding PadR family transcriptional regulator [Catenuloplanes nepalensis]
MALRMTTPRLLAVQAFLEDPAREWYGLELAQRAGLEPGTVYPILIAFENAGWLASRDDDIDPHAEGRPRRRYYRLTADGIEAAQEWARAAQRRHGARRVREGFAW